MAYLIYFNTNANVIVFRLNFDVENCWLIRCFRPCCDIVGCDSIGINWLICAPTSSLSSYCRTLKLPRRDNLFIWIEGSAWGEALWQIIIPSSVECKLSLYFIVELSFDWYYHTELDVFLKIIISYRCSTGIQEFQTFNKNNLDYEI